MKKYIIVLVYILITVAGLFAETDEKNLNKLRDKRMGVDISLETAIPFLFDEGEEIRSTGLYVLSYTMIRTSYQWTFLSLSDYFNLGFGIDIFQNPLTMVGSAFWGGIGLNIYNDFFFDNIVVSPYLKSHLVYASWEVSNDYYTTVFFEGYFDFSAGVNVTIYDFLLDIGYNTPISGISNEAILIHCNAHAIRIGLGYNLRFS